MNIIININNYRTILKIRIIIKNGTSGFRLGHFHGCFRKKIILYYLIVKIEYAIFSLKFFIRMIILQYSITLLVFVR